MSCPFLKPHYCAGCDDAWRCDGGISPQHVLVEDAQKIDKAGNVLGVSKEISLVTHVITENLEICFEGDYRGCPNYVLGLEQKALAKQIKLNTLKKGKLVERGMEYLESELRNEPDCVSRLEMAKELHRKILSDLHEYKAEVRRLKGRTK